MESERLAKELAEENKKLKAENESILRNLDRDRLNRVKFEAEHGDTVLELKKLKEDVQNRDGKLAELQSLLDQYKMQVNIVKRTLVRNKKYIFESGFSIHRYKLPRKNLKRLG